MNPLHAIRQFLQRSEASGLVEAAFILPPLLVLFVGVVDVGRGAYAAIEVSSAAEAGALYGTLNPTDTTGMRNAAILDAGDINNLTATPSYGCECSDGTAVTPNCTSAPTCTTVVYYVEVDTSTSYTPILRYPGITTPMPISAASRLRSGF